MDDVFARSMCDRRAKNTDVTLRFPEALVGAEGTCTSLLPPKNGADVRLLVDFGEETVGFFEFELTAYAGTILDIVGFENRQPDGTLDWTEGTNNSMRYICREGRQHFRSFIRRGLRYAYLIFRRLSAPVQIGKFAVIENIYPQANRGAFCCSDSLLNRIWQVGARTLACCSEDTYVDCPAYEQVHWVGDARNEALVDWAVNGDGRLWRHGLLQAAQSLERSVLIESHVPSSWPVILPAWSFLWIRSCREYYLFTGDREGIERLWPYLMQQIQNIDQFFDADGLFAFRGWNMFDWADMDTPDEGVVTHQNCLLVLALKEVAELAQWLQKGREMDSLRTRAEQLSRAINQHLYDDRRRAYVDARHADGRLSPTLSQQTQTVAVVSGLASGKRMQKAWQDMLHPPWGYVRAGSPFFMFFLLEALQAREETELLLATLRENWGMMIEQGATTFWEMWSGKGKRKTRSHCHGWSAAPTYFLSTYILGIQPVMPGFVKTRIAPHPGDLRWARGKMPTPAGDIFIEWEKQGSGDWQIYVRVPESIEVEVLPPTPHSKVEVEATH
ncbi:MAG: hypothetical protein D6814_11690 [Calditrichaeota bacterium]|nr:MAG: hypothetical protein D6814_11690 [Calditrichota bacterium]